jgi:hypothetical protein
MWRIVRPCLPPPPPPHARAPHLPFLSPRAHSLSVVKVFYLSVAFSFSLSLQCALHGVLKRAYIRLSLTATHCSLAPRTFQDLLRVGDGGGGGARGGHAHPWGAYMSCTESLPPHGGISSLLKGTFFENMYRNDID